MERNIGDQLNKAFEAYRQASIEKDNAKKELQETTEYYKRYTQTLQKQIEDQQQLITRLEAQLRSTTNQPSGGKKCEVLPRKQEDGIELPCNHLLDNTLTNRKMHYLKETMEGAVIVPHTLPVLSNVVNKDMLEVLEAIQGKFQQIRSLTRRQKNHLKKIYGGKDSFNDQEFSMPIQCTDSTAEQAERPFPAVLRSGGGDVPRPPTSLASRGASPEDGDLDYSLNKLSVKFPPRTDVEYDFLNSAPEKDIALLMTRNMPLGPVPGTEAEGVPAVLVPFPYPSSPSHATSPSTSLSQESVCGPQQPLWSPDLSDAVAQAVSVNPSQTRNPDECAFCQAEIPRDRMNSHLYSHCYPKNEAVIDAGNRD